MPHRILDICGLISFASLLALGFFHLWNADGWPALGFTALCLLPAYYLADLFTGFVHWVCDSFGSESTPLWGPILVAPFRRHHRTPLEITRISLAENLGASGIAGTIVLLFCRPGAGDASWGWHLWLWFLVFSFLSNLFHRWAHWPAVEKPRWMISLQNLRLVLPSDPHLVHHRPPHRVNYCILSGWANGLSNRMPWSRFESWLARIGIPTHFD